MTLPYDLLPLYALGALDRDEAERVEAALAADPALRAELRALTEVAAQVGGALDPVAPAPELRARLLASLDLADRVAVLFDLGADQARAVLGWVDDPTRWLTMAPGIEVAAVTAGPAQRGKQCGLLRVAAGTHFPWHGHVGEEVSLVVAGGARMADGRAIAPGDEVVVSAAVEHDFVVDADGPCVFAVRTDGMRIA